MLTRVCDGVWVDCGPVSFLGLRLTATMTVLRVGDGTLLVHSPLPLTDARKAAVSELGVVSHLYAPNTFHHQWLGEWIAAFTETLTHAPTELATKRPDLRIDRFHDQANAQPIDGVDEVPVRGFRLRETVLVHRASGTAVVADLVHNIGRPDHTWTRLYTKAMGFYDQVALSRMLRWTGFDDRGAARASVDELLDHAFDTLIVGHGSPIAGNARDMLAAATQWLPKTAPPRLPRLPADAKQAPRFTPRPCG